MGGSVPRQREFDPDQVLDRAMRLFWRQGYNNTSLQELEEVMGINRFSIYATFQDKHSLFLAALERYRETVVAMLIGGMEEPDAGLDAIHHFFRQLVELAQGEMGSWGCLICNSATELALHDSDVAQQMAKYKERITRASHPALANAQQQGELTDDANLEALSIYLLGSLFGLMVYTKTNISSAQLAQYVQTVLAHLK
jgi:TetR/AcrR family transcriptional regulator, transcriptional repressor for nem operon